MRADQGTEEEESRHCVGLFVHSEAIVAISCTMLVNSNACHCNPRPGISPCHLPPRRTRGPSATMIYCRNLVEGVGSGAPPGEEQAQADGFKDTAENTNSDNIHGTFLGSDLSNELQPVSVVRIEEREVTYAWTSRSAED